ncbi:hypothetical protein EUTSA_v10012240mg, partial [Eutrema salsugineum]
MGSNVAVTTIVKNWREHPPSSYSLKINKLSQLNLDKYVVSCPVDTTGTRLVIYPKGNGKDYGSGFISMYVEMDNTSPSSTSQVELFAKAIHALRRVWGLSQVFALQTFDDPKNGYIFEELTYPKFSWSVKDFWMLTLYPKGLLKPEGEWLSIFLQLDDSETLMEDEKIYVRAHLRVLDQ